MKATPVSPVILASESPRRKELLEQMNLAFRVLPSRLAELPVLGELPNAYVARMAMEKAMKAAEEHPEAVVIGADTVVALDDRILEKPATPEEARLMLSLLSGRWHEVWTGISVICLRRRFEETRAVKSRVRFRDLDEDEIDAYVATGEPMDKAGAYAIQGGARPFVQEIQGSFHNVVGMPTLELARILERAGVEIDSRWGEDRQGEKGCSETERKR